MTTGMECLRVARVSRASSRRTTRLVLGVLLLTAVGPGRGTESCGLCYEGTGVRTDAYVDEEGFSISPEVANESFISHRCEDLAAQFAATSDVECSEGTLEWLGNARRTCCNESASFCPSATYVRDKAYGHAAGGCCRWARTSAVYCDPSGASRQYQRDAADLYCRAMGATVQALAGREASCASLCDSDTDCVVWTYSPSTFDNSFNFIPAMCHLASEDLGCSAASCDAPGYVSGRRNCRLTGLSHSALQADPQGNLAAVAPELASKSEMCTSGREPDVDGIMSQGQLLVNSGCYHPLWDYSGPAQSCLNGKWHVVVGGSNSVLLAAQAVNMLTLVPGSFNVGRAMVGSATLVDTVVEDGEILYQEYFMTCTGCIWDQEPQASQMSEWLMQAPPPGAARTRVTLFVGQYWDNVAYAVDVIESSAAWASVEVSLMTMIGFWYILRAPDRHDIAARVTEDLCPSGNGSSILERAFDLDMQSVLESRLERFCGPTGRAGRLGCTFASNAYTRDGSVGVGEWATCPGALFLSRHQEDMMLNDIMRKHAFLATGKFNFIDIWKIGQAAGLGESMEAHSSSLIFVWAWQVKLGSFCPAENVSASSGRVARLTGSCFAIQAHAALCPTCEGCVDWMCLNSGICRLEALSVNASTEIQGRFFCERQSWEFQPSSNSSASTSSVDPCSGRVWCEEDLTWVPVLASVVAAALLFAWTKFDARKAAKAKAASAKGKGGAKEEKAPAKASQEEKPKTATLVDTEAPQQEKPKAATLVDTEAPAPPLSAEKAETSAASTDDPEAGGEPSTACTGLPEEDIGIPQEGIAKVPFGGDKRQDGHIHKAKKEAEDFAVLVEAIDLTVEAESPLSLTQVAPADLSSFGVGSPATSTKGAKAASDVQSSKPATPAASSTVQSSAPSADEDGSRPKKKKPKAKSEIFPLGLSRMTASMHVVAGHMYADGHIAEVRLYGWGFTWVPYFFILSGFVLYSAEAARPTKETIFTYVARRSVSIYPLYVVGLVAAFFIKAGTGTLPEWYYLLSQVWLLQAWAPQLTEQVLQVHCWFLSCMVVYWVLFLPIAQWVKKLNLVASVVALFLLFIPPWFVVWIGAGLDDLEWYQKHRYGSTDTALDLWVVFLKFHPACYFHMFLLGMVLCQLRRNLARHAQDLWLVMELLAPVGIASLLCIFCIEDLEPWAYKMSCRLTVLAPFQAAVMIGLSGLPGARLPLAGRLALKVEFLSEYSYGVYVFQFVCYYLWPSTAKVGPLFFVFVLATAVAAVELFQRPLTKWWRTHERGRWAIPVILSVALPLLAQIDWRSISQRGLGSLPHSVVYDKDMVDFRLPFSFHGDGAIINPSLAVKDGTLYAAARLHRRSYHQEYTQYLGADATLMETTWHSTAVMGSMPLDHWKQAVLEAKGEPAEQWSSMALETWTGLQTVVGGPWSDLCPRETWIPENRTLLRQVVTGPEDPKLLKDVGAVSRSGVAIVFNSYPPEGAPPLEGACGASAWLGSVSQVYMASDNLVGFSPSETVAAYRMDCGWTHEAEKNWIAFEYEGGLNFVYSPEPHSIRTARKDGSCAEVYQTNFGPWQRMLLDYPQLRIRGSGTAVYVDQASRTPSMARPHYLAMMHIVDMDTGEYSHFAYRFSASPPFEVLQVSEKLPILELESDVGAQAFAFISGLSVDDDGQVLISYGAGDRDARVLALTLNRLDQFFECCDDNCTAGAWRRWASVGHWGRQTRGDFGYNHSEECLAPSATAGSIANVLSGDSALGVMCCDTSEEWPRRQCELCNGAAVLEDHVLGEACFDLFGGKVLSSCADQRVELCTELGGEMRPFTCADVQAAMILDDALCSEAVKRRFAAHCCADVSPVFLEPSIFSGCSICQPGALMANTAIGMVDDRPYTCGEAQSHILSGGGEMCAADWWRPTLEASCCSGGRGGSSGMDRRLDVRRLQDNSGQEILGQQEEAAVCATAFAAGDVCQGRPLKQGAIFDLWDVRCEDMASVLDYCCGEELPCGSDFISILPSAMEACCEVQTFYPFGTMCLEAECPWICTSGFLVEEAIADDDTQETCGNMQERLRTGSLVAECQAARDAGTITARCCSSSPVTKGSGCTDFADLCGGAAVNQEKTFLGEAGDSYSCQDVIAYLTTSAIDEVQCQQFEADGTIDIWRQGCCEGYVPEACRLCMDAYPLLQDAAVGDSTCQDLAQELATSELATCQRQQESGNITAWRSTCCRGFSDCHTLCPAQSSVSMVASVLDKDGQSRTCQEIEAYLTNIPAGECHDHREDGLLSSWRETCCDAWVNPQASCMCAGGSLREPLEPPVQYCDGGEQFVTDVSCRSAGHTWVQMNCSSIAAAMAQTFCLSEELAALREMCCLDGEICARAAWSWQQDMAGEMIEEVCADLTASHACEAQWVEICPNTPLLVGPDTATLDTGCHEQCNRRLTLSAGSDNTCSDSLCTSAGNDCCAPFGEEKTCASGFEPHVIGSCVGDPSGLYTCCSPGSAPQVDPFLGQCREDYCTSYGNDCCAAMGEPQTCSNGYVPKVVSPCADNPDGYYVCCPPEVVESTSDEVCRTDFCTSFGGDCCAPFGERKSCAFGYTPKAVGECYGDPEGAYTCCASEGDAEESSCPELCPTGSLKSNTMVETEWGSVSCGFINETLWRMPQQCHHLSAWWQGTCCDGLEIVPVSTPASNDGEACQAGFTFGEAQSHCKNLGGKLCTREQLRNGEGRGCFVDDASLVWTADACTPGEEPTSSLDTGVFPAGW